MKSSVALVATLLAGCQLGSPGGRVEQAPAQTASPAPAYERIEFASPPPHDADVSLVRILANPEAMHGNAVYVGGYMHLQFEANMLCLHHDDVQHMILTNCVWLQLPDPQRALVLNDRYVNVRGVVNAKDRGHLGLFQATLDAVTSIGALSREQVALRSKGRYR